MVTGSSSVQGDEAVPVAGVLRTGVVNTNDHKDMLEVRANVLGCERQSARLLEDDGHYIVSYMPLPQELND